MPTMTTPLEEERAARGRHRQLTRARKAAERKRAKEAQSKLATIIRDELAKPRARSCSCGLTPRTTQAELAALGAGCTAGRNGRAGYVCPTLDAVRRRMGR